jgi:hypothetical protein
MPTGKRNTALFILLLLFFLSCDPPEYLENNFSSDLSIGEDPVTAVPNTDKNEPEFNENISVPEKQPEDVKPGEVLKRKSDLFFQNKNKRKKIDILWVIDNSGSMEDEQNSLARNFDLFIEEFLKKDIDFRMAITTTDSYQRGRAVKGLYGLSSKEALVDETSFLDDFNERVRVGTKGSGREQGLLTSLSFLRHYDGRFIRNEAFLIIIYVSDEDDQSNWNVNRVLFELTKYKKNPGKLKIYSIVNQKHNLFSYFESVGKKYCDLSMKTGGLCSNIKDDFSHILKAFGENIVDLKNLFILTERPNPLTIEVFVEGNKVQRGWSYDSKVNAIRFEESFLPHEGEKVMTHYRY